LENKKDLRLYFMLFSTLVLPILVGLYMQNYADFRFVSVPLHSFLEASGAMIAFVLSAIIYIMYQDKLELNHFHRASFALIAMGVFDAFHAMTYPGELFVWLHSLAVFFGGVLFSFVWISDMKISKKSYRLIPLVVLSFSVFISLISILYPQIVPQMLNEKKEFTDIANILNIIGGAMFVIASLYFIKKYLENYETDDLLFAGHTMLFGSAGVLFFFSNLWDMQWWFWHTLRLLAYIVSLYFILELFYKSLNKIHTNNEEINSKNSELKKSIKLLEEYKKAIQQGSIISTANKGGIITYVNDELLKVTGYKKEELIGKPHSIFRDPSTPKSTFKEMWSTIQNKETYKGLLKNKRKDGSVFYANITIVPILDENDEIYEYIALRDDVTELVNSQVELKKIFFTDSLTGLNNRFKLSHDLKQLAKAKIALINIDNFKNINDFYGQEYGDSVIKDLSVHLIDFAYDNDYMVYRNHADEFAIVSNNQKENFIIFEQNIKNFTTLINNTHFKIDDELITLTISAGISCDTNDTLLSDIALKEAKRAKKHSVVYSDNLNIKSIFDKNIQWTKKLKNALDEDRIDIVLQPLLNNSIDKITKYEVLVRYIETDGSVVSPFEFLDVAKRSKLYGKITKQVVKKAFNTLAKLECEISINICAEDIMDDETKEFILNNIKSSSNSNRLVIELVESEGIESFSEVKEFLDEIKKYDVKLAIDDFGTGYSNFDYLLKLQADFIKIDGSMIKNIDIDPNSFNVVETIVSFGKKNNMKIIAEFVSSQNIQNKIKELDIEFSQGYFISAPKFLDEILEDEI